MTKIALLLALASAAGLSQAEETCAVKTVHAPVLEVNDLHEDIDMPQTATTCENGKCESHVVKIDHFSTGPRFQIVLGYKGGTASYEAEEAPTGKTVLVQVQECGKKHAPRSMKPAV
ncbi:hypothetical protein R70006_04925 [Paraburkholderia domus]|uniref:hypothetical protein n=1 Tax=Paraburkholderia domus TaxID=2793075 RepID=UPI001912D4B1|nr:hypothetical protein [Paraburkholderia domus]MBK5051836.1 hypothetical protein [Burkholderia sp. R-70006]CAE6792800.1 hypothetical protein R70006_04925 [Paraburkholderia domus]